MNKHNLNRRTFLAGVLGAGMSASLCQRSAFAQGEAAPIEEGFTPLFDGKTLDGWHTNREKIGHGTGGKWAVEDGAIAGEQDPPGNGGMLMSDKEFGDFDLMLELNPDWGIDTGVFLRANPQGVCFQVYVDYHDHGNVGWISTEATGGQKRLIIRPFDLFGTLDENGKLKSLTTKPDEREVAWKPDYLLYSATPQTFLETWKIGRWNAMRIRCVGKYPRITTWINDVKMADFDGATCPQRDYKKEEIYRQLGDKGPIAFQVHGGKQMWKSGAKCRWRNIRVKAL
jgi:hypothetical protein